MKDFVAYIPVGYPDMEVTVRVLKVLDTLPVKAVELGIPFSDPIADGPVIQTAHAIALKNGVTLERVLNMISKIKVRYGIYVMSYLNVLLRFPSGVNELVRRLHNLGVQGLIIPDLPLKEMDNVQIDFPLVPFVAPNTKDEEIRRINEMEAPFVYYISRFGVTGTRRDLPFLDHIEKVKKTVNKPLYVGFGISRPEQVKAVWKVADGVIVGSALVKIMEKFPASEIPSQIEKAIEELLEV